MVGIPEYAPDPGDGLSENDLTDIEQQVIAPGGSLHHPPPKGWTKKAPFRVAISVQGTPECFCK